MFEEIVYLRFKLAWQLLTPMVNYCNYTRNCWNLIYDAVWSNIFTENPADPEKLLTLSPNLEKSTRA